MVTEGRTRRRGRRVTISDLARELGLSQSSVSAALNDTPGVSDDTRARVKALADQLGWRPHAGARALRTQRAMTIGLVLARNPEQLAAEPFYSLVLGGIEQVLQDSDYSLLLRMVGVGRRDLGIYRRWHDEHAVDGVILFDLVDADPRVELLNELDLEFVAIGEHDPHDTSLHVGTDTDVEARMLVDHVADLGHEHICHVAGPHRFRHERLRREAVARHAGRRGVRLTTVESDYGIQPARAAVEELFGRCPDAADRPTALLASSDLIALGALQALQGLGVPVPAGVSLCSWDDSLTGRLLTPALTSLDRNPPGIGRAAATLLLDRLAGRTVPAHRFAPAPTLEVRGTSASPGLVATT